MIGYLSGPITGHKNYRQQFARAAGTLKEMGYAVINPAELGAALPLDQMSYCLLYTSPSPRDCS